MSELLHATDTASRVGLVKALERAAAAGRTSMVETVLGALTERFPTAGHGDAIRALNRAVHSHRWETAAYLADYLADTSLERPPRGGVAGGAAPRPHRNRATEHIDQEVLRCLREHAEENPDEPFRLTDAVEDACVRRGVDFAISVAIVDCAAEDVPPPERLECARQKVGGDDDSHDIITFEYADPGLPPEEYGSVDNPAPCFSLSNPDFSARHLRGAEDRVVPPGEITIEITEPPSLAGTHGIVTDGSRVSLARAVAGKYQDLYDDVSSADAEAGQDLTELDLARLRPVSEADGDSYVVELA